MLPPDSERQRFRRQDAHQRQVGDSGQPCEPDQAHTSQYPEADRPHGRSQKDACPPQDSSRFSQPARLLLRGRGSQRLDDHVDDRLLPRRLPVLLLEPRQRRPRLICFAVGIQLRKRL